MSSLTRSKNFLQVNVHHDVVTGRDQLLRRFTAWSTLGRLAWARPGLPIRGRPFLTIRSEGAAAVIQLGELMMQVERNLKDVGDQALVRGLDTAVPSIRPGLSRSYNGRRLKAGHKADAGHSPAAVPPAPVREYIRLLTGGSGALRLPGDRPHEANKLACNCCADHCCLLAASTHAR